jgi:hypothetical protein
VSTQCDYTLYTVHYMFYKVDCHELREWIEYHRLVGVDHFYIYDNNPGTWSCKSWAGLDSGADY